MDAVGNYKWINDLANAIAQSVQGADKKQCDKQNPKQVNLIEIFGTLLARKIIEFTKKEATPEELTALAEVAKAYTRMAEVLL